MRVSCPLREGHLQFPAPTTCLPFYLLVFNSLDMSRSVSVTTAGQCRLAPLIQVILDCSHLYDYTVKLLFKLHSCEYARPDHLCVLGAGKGSQPEALPGEMRSPQRPFSCCSQRP